MKKVICAVILLFVFLLPFPQSAFAAEMDELLQEELRGIREPGMFSLNLPAAVLLL